MSLSTQDRHALETEMSSRLVRARALLGKWQAGLDEVRAARSNGDVGELDAALSKWSFSTEDPEVASAKEDLQRWQWFASIMPPVLSEAVGKRNVEQMREAIDELSSCGGPACVEGSELAKKMLSRYTVEARALDDAVASGNSNKIHIALQVWEFGKDDPHAVDAMEALRRRGQQKAMLRAATASLDGLQLSHAVAAWHFERSDEDFVAACEVLQRYKRAAADLERLGRPPADLQGLSAAVAVWEFSRGDAALAVASGQLAECETRVRNALARLDGWQLQRLWVSGSQGRSLGEDLRQEVAALLQRYSDAVSELRRELLATNTDTIVDLLDAWAFADDDPHVHAARMWLRLRSAVGRWRLEALREASSAGHIALLRGALQRVQGASNDSREVREARAASATFDAALEATGALALGARPGEMRATRLRRLALLTAEQRIIGTLGLLEPESLSDIKCLRKPPSAVHGVFQVTMHMLAGLHPHVRDPPRDTHWRSCQRMVTNAPVFLSTLASVPTWIASGHRSGISVARRASSELQERLRSNWSVEGLRPQSATAALLLEYLERVFEYHDLLDLADRTAGSVDSEDREESGTETLQLSVLQRRPSGTEGSSSSSEEDALGVSGVPEKPSRTSERRVSRPTSLRSQTLPAELIRDLLLCEDPGKGKTVEFRPGQAVLLHCLFGARRVLCGNASLAAAWVVAGGDTEELETGLQRVRHHACAAEAAALVASAVLRALVAAADSTPERALAPAEPQNPQLPLRRRPASLRRGTRVQDPPRVGTSQPATDVWPERGSAVTVAGNNTGSICNVAGPKTVLQTLSAARAAIAACTSRDLEALGSDGRPLSEAAEYLLFGAAAENTADTLHTAMLQALRSAFQIVQQHAAGEGSAADVQTLAPPWAVQLCAEYVCLDEATVRSLKIPQANFSLALRALAAADGTAPGCAAPITGGATPIGMFVMAMQSFYLDFVLQRALTATREAAAREAKDALSHAEKVVGAAHELMPMDRLPPSHGQQLVREAAAKAAKQLQVMAQVGLALPDMHVEHVRQAIDRAGLDLLSHPPGARPSERLAWAEAAVALQTTSLPLLASALASMARALDGAQLEALSRGTSPEGQLLLAAVFWVLEPGSEASWEHCQQQLLAAGDFMERLASWELLREASPSGLLRARELLLVNWVWVTNGCDGVPMLAALSCWVSLAVALLPLVEMGQRLAPVQQALHHGKVRAARARPAQRAQAEAAAWRSALFLLDARDKALEDWWWLRLIRPSALHRPPWPDNDEHEWPEEQVRQPAGPIAWRKELSQASSVANRVAPDGGSEGEDDRLSLALSQESDIYSDVGVDTWETDGQLGGDAPHSFNWRVRRRHQALLQTGTLEVAWSEELVQELSAEEEDVFEVAQVKSA